MIKLREYQSNAVKDLIAALRRSERKKVILEMPTGGGKTVVFSYIAQNAVKKNSRTIILTDRSELLRGTGGTLEDFGLSPSYITAGRKHPPIDGILFVGMAQTLRNRLKKTEWVKWLKSFSLVIIDEVHKQEFNSFFLKGVFDSCHVIGVSATPKRGGKQRQLGLDFDEIVHTLTVCELIEMSFLMPDMYYGFNDLAPDTKGVSKNIAGDFSESDMFKRYDNPKLYGGVVEQWFKLVPHTITIVFCTNIIHAVRTTKEFCKFGIPAKFVVSEMGKPKRPEGYEPEIRKDAPVEWVKYWEKFEYYNEYCEAMSSCEYVDSFSSYSGPRSRTIDEWKSGRFKVLVNAGILTTGFDFPEIETVVLFRATISEVLYLQMLGRGSRPCSKTGKTHFNILDFGGNAKRLGGYKMPRKWHLFHESKSGNGVPPVKECGEPGVDKNKKKGCGDYILASCKICPNCGYVYPDKSEPKKIELDFMVSDGKGKMKATKRIEDMSFEELDMFRKVNNYKPNWLNIQLYKIGGIDKLEEYAYYKGYSPGWITRAESFIPSSVKSYRESLIKQSNMT